MWPAERPEFTASQVIEAIASRLRDDSLRSRLLASAPTADANAAIYDAHATAVALRDAGSALSALPRISHPEMELLYEKLRTLKQPRAEFWDRMRLAGPFSRCALCGTRTATTLDHVLPRAAVPAVVVEPLNLVPACGRCNGRLGGALATDDSTERVHAYFEGARFRWLYATLISESPLTVVFSCWPPLCLAPAYIDRLQRQFNQLDLNGLYNEMMPQDLASISMQFRTLFPEATAEKAAQILHDSARAELESVPNSYAGALREALAGSAEWCSAVAAS